MIWVDVVKLIAALTLGAFATSCFFWAAVIWRRGRA